VGRGYVFGSYFQLRDSLASSRAPRDALLPGVRSLPNLPAHGWLGHSPAGRSRERPAAGEEAGPRVMFANAVAHTGVKLHRKRS